MLIKLCPACNKKVMLKSKSCECGHVLSDMIVVASDSRMTGVTSLKNRRYRKLRSCSKGPSSTLVNTVSSKNHRDTSKKSRTPKQRSQTQKRNTKSDKNLSILNGNANKPTQLSLPKQKQTEDDFFFQSCWLKQNDTSFNEIAMATALDEINAKIAVQRKIWSLVDSS